MWSSTRLRRRANWRKSRRSLRALRYAILGGGVQRSIVAVEHVRQGPHYVATGETANLCSREAATGASAPGGGRWGGTPGRTPHQASPEGAAGKACPPGTAATHPGNPQTVTAKPKQIPLRESMRPQPAPDIYFPRIDDARRSIPFASSTRPNVRSNPAKFSRVVATSGWSGPRAFSEMARSRW